LLFSSALFAYLIEDMMSLQEKFGIPQPGVNAKVHRPILPLKLSQLPTKRRQGFLAYLPSLGSPLSLVLS
jgi:hypothetical protein